VCFTNSDWTLLLDSGTGAVYMDVEIGQGPLGMPPELYFPREIHAVSGVSYYGEYQRIINEPELCYDLL